MRKKGGRQFNPSKRGKVAIGGALLAAVTLFDQRGQRDAATRRLLTGTLEEWLAEADGNAVAFMPFVMH